MRSLFLFRLLDRSVAIRTTFCVLVIISAIMIPAGILQMQHVRSIVTTEVNRQANRSIETAIKILDNRISKVETALNTAASYANMFAPHESLVDKLLIQLISSNKDISAVTLLYRAGYFERHGRYYAPTIYRSPATGELVVNEIGGPGNEFCYLETDSNWVYTNLLDKGYWGLPYVDSMSTKQAMVTYSVPLHDEEGSTYAVLCADIDLKWVKNILEETKPYSYAEFLVLSRDSQFVCHPDKSWIQSVNAIKYAQQKRGREQYELARRMLSWERGGDTMETNALHMTTANADSKRFIFFAPIERIQWSVCYSIPQSKILEGPNRLHTNMLLLLVVLLILISLALYLIIRAQLWPIKQLAASTHDVAMGNFNTQLPAIKTRDEIRNLRDSFESMQSSLAQHIEKLQEITASKASMESELHVASEIQKSMLPKVFPPYPERNDIDVYGQLMPAKAVGGDLFDFFIRDEKLFFCIGDVSGKGIPASLVMAVTQTQFRTIAAHEANPDRIMGILNDSLNENNERHMFVTLFIGVLDLPTGRMRYCNAGHDAPVVAGAHDSMLPCDANLPIGVMPGYKFSLQETTIHPSTTVFLYTDGLTEAEDENLQLFGKSRILETINAAPKQPQQLITAMTEAVNHFVGKAEQSDDLTMMAIQYTHQQLDVTYQRSITLPNDIEAVPRLAEFVDEVCEAMSFDPSTAMQINLAIEEAVVNVMNYAYPSGIEGSVTIEAQANEKRLKFTITDNGAAFDPTARAEVDTTLPADQRAIGGLGIHLIRQIMDSINYERVGGMNVLTLRKKLKQDVQE